MIASIKVCSVYSRVQDTIFKQDGRKVIPTPILQARDGKFGTSALSYAKATGAITKPAVRPTTVWFGESPDVTYNSGAISLGNLANPQIKITHADPGTTKEMVIVYDYYKLLVVSPASGVIDVGLSN